MRGVSPFSILLGLSDATISILASSPFKFVVDGNVLYIHAGLIALHSVPLNRMINGPMSEAQKGYAELQDVDKGTFIRFIRWAYSGMYFAAEFRTDPTQEFPTVSKKGKKGSKEKKGSMRSPTLEKSAIEVTEPIAFAEPAPPPPPVEGLVDFDVPEPASAFDLPPWGQPTKKSKKVVDLGRSGWGAWGTGMKESFIGLQYHVPETTFSTPPPRSNQGPLEDYSEVFLSHARVYVFADKYDIEPLKKLALQNLHQTLTIYTLYPERCRDIIELIRYSYTHTADRGDGVEGLRALLTHYMGHEMATLARDEGFRTLLLENEGPILGDFLNKVTERID